MTAQQLVLDLLQYIGVYGFASSENANALNEPGLDESDTRKAVSAINAALQEIYDKGPETLRHDKLSAFLWAPTILTVTVVQGEASATITSSPPDDMEGCSILIMGDSDLNEVTAVDGLVLTLQRAYTGASATIGATIYKDATLLPVNVTAVVEPIEITPNIRLYPAQSREHFDHLSYSRQDYGGISRGTWYSSGTNKQVGVPTLYFVEHIGQRLVLRLNPMPPSIMNVTYHCNVAAETIDPDFDIDDDTDPGREFESLPPFMQDSILLPIARFKFFSHPALKNSELRGWVKAEYDTATTSLINKPNRSVHGTRARFL